MNRWLILAMLFFSTVGFSQNQVPPRVVRVIGKADVKVVPDRAVIELGVEMRNASAKIAKTQVDVASRKIISSMVALGIESIDLRTSSLTLSPQYDYRKDTEVTSFVAAQSLTVTVHDLGKVDKVIDALIEAGGNKIDSIEYEISQDRKYLDEARQLALKAAKDKATILAEGLGQKLGKAYSISEVQSDNFAGLPNNVQIVTRSGGGGGGGGSVTTPGQLTITSTIEVSFDLE